MASNKDKARRFFQEAWSEGKLGVLDELVAPDFEGDIPLVGKLDRDGLKATISAYRKSFPDLTYELTDVMGEGDKVTVHWIARGTGQGDFMGLPASNRPVAVKGFSLMSFKGGKIANGTTEYDAVGFLKALGVQVPAPGPDAKVPLEQRGSPERH